MSTATPPTHRRRSATELRNRPTRDLLKDVAKLRGRIERGDLTAQELAQERQDLAMTERELRGRLKGKGE